MEGKEQFEESEERVDIVIDLPSLSQEKPRETIGAPVVKRQWPDKGRKVFDYESVVRPDAKRQDAAKREETGEVS